MYSFKDETGTTLLEVMLVLAIVSSLVLLTLQVNTQRQKQQQRAQLLYNVNQLFLAASLYYKSQCYGVYNSSGIFIPGDLNPQTLPRPLPASQTVPSTTSPFVLTDLNASLVVPGYLPNWNPVNLYVDFAAANNGYTVQFNPVVTTAAAVNLSKSDYPPACISPDANCTRNLLPSSQAAVLLWRIQVAVKVLDPTLTSSLLSLLGADCESSLNVVSGVNLCSPIVLPGGYLVWERVPSSPESQMSSILSSSLPGVIQFNMQYTHDQMYELGSGYTTSLPKYYLCGG